MELSSIGIELHVEYPLPPEWKQCLDLQVCFLLLFFLGNILCFHFIHGFWMFFSLNSPLGLFDSSIFFLITNCVSLLLMVSFVGY